MAIEFPNSYEGCITSFCDPKLFQKKFAFNVLDADNVWACFGCHPHHAHLYNADVEAQLEILAKHPKVFTIFYLKKILDKIKTRVLGRMLMEKIHKKGPLQFKSLSIEGLLSFFVTKS